ncbi:uncharacterized protein LOC110248781 [Exaiptasia diaphana]|uniref:MARVEL domain-containing protein n=1 Tax=Exaiptasia diaphana TaxID=2652724 RepID=A0A913YS57_EXADI|nr:uncharacterized protein LOC110248781 [Exaiptasia diaphana]XP_020910993.1 uncharacterized protein LOC110248781 [Exaiptasia diaphana]XP_028517893.1 uncharacterized protein LOC110248781 [Exaiptasia diaphana]KXJ24178.1 hypothetical protein AC249_AIPGENE4687 [Exaiptasia diaphana]
MAKRNARNNNEGQSYDEDDGVLYVNMSYIMSCPSVLRILECIFLIAAMACMVQYEVHWAGYPAKVIFFYVVVCVSWILVFIFYVLMVCTIDKRFPNYDWGLCIVFTSVVAAIFLMASAGLMADEARKHRGLEWKEIFTTSKKVHFDNLVAAVVLAFIAALIFIIDAIFHLIMFYREWKRRKEHKKYRDNRPIAESEA